MNWQALAEFNEGLLQFSIGIALFFVVLEAIRNRTRANLGYLSAIMLLIALMQLNVLFYIRGTLLDHLWVAYCYAPSAVLIGPLSLKLSQRVTEGGIPGNRGSLIHYVPTLVMLIGVIYLASLPEAEQRAQISEGMQRFSFDLVNVSAIVMLIGYESYFIYIIYWLIRLQKHSEDYIHLGLLTIFVVTAAIPGILAAIGFFAKSILFYHLCATVGTVAVAGIYLLSSMHSDFFHSLMPRIREMKYKNTNIDNLDVDGLLRQISAMVEDDQIHLNSDLKLKDMALELSVSPHQLSRIINERFGQNFNEFINFHRIEEAKKLLLEDEDTTILRVAFLAGFSTKSAFNNQFQRFVHLSPTEFRKQKRG